MRRDIRMSRNTEFNLLINILCLMCDTDHLTVHYTAYYCSYIMDMDKKNIDLNLTYSIIPSTDHIELQVPLCWLPECYVLFCFDLNLKLEHAKKAS